MATLTTTGGATITFHPAAIFAIADHDDNTGEASTCIFGIGASRVLIDETVQGFMQRLNITVSFAQLTRPNGYPVWIKGSAVSTIRAADPGEYTHAPTVKTVIVVGSLTQGVIESVEQATAALNAHGAGL